ncbi:hypothetical protein B0T14DRAFT_540211 [Immersiella caudata]|uniref:Amidohydrolase-related domain-containing protein n=1 Tax=Immersiella caudata TaxID=314043 RepID=A0AA39TS77_9PEZI|nr:hypothetical protein B0T14DRAFT_540211 [Immersiella caudata]
MLTTLLLLLHLLSLPLTDASILFTHGTLITFNRTAYSLSVLRNASLLVANNQTAYKTLGSNTTLVEYFFRYDELASAGLLMAEDVCLGQLAGIYEGLNAGVTTTSKAGARASVDSGGGGGGGRYFGVMRSIRLMGAPSRRKFSSFRDIAVDSPVVGSSTMSIGIAYDTFHPDGNTTQIDTLRSLISEFNTSVLTTHVLSGPWGAENMPLAVLNLGILSLDLPIVFSHASLISAYDFQLLRRYNQHISITSESETHFGQTNSVSHRIQDQAALGVDTHFTFSSDIVTQARVWLHEVRRRGYDPVLESVNQAFLLTTRQGGLALHREDLGVIEVGAKADLVVWDGLRRECWGGNDPVAAVMLHASVGDVKHIADAWYDELKKRFLASAKRLQTVLIESASEAPKKGDAWAFSGYPVGTAETIDTLRGNGIGYGEFFLDASES